MDGLLAEAGSGLATAGHSRQSPGVTAAQAADTLVVPWNDREGVERALAGGDVRGARCASPTRRTWVWCRRRTASWPSCARPRDATGTLLVFDEVITGFRVARGGAQEREGVIPDLTILGKVIGGGLPAAAYAGLARADVAAWPPRATSTRRARCRATRWPRPPGWRP